jgi:copper chaperone CopZ
MTCDHCVLSVAEEVSEIQGVADVDVDLGSGLVTVSGHGFTDEQVAGAVGEAGYGIAA